MRECPPHALVEAPLDALMAAAAKIRDERHGRTLTYSPKVFLPVTNLCRNVCEYCTYRRSPGDPGEHTMSPEEIGGAVRAGRAAGCTEALLCLGDRPEAGFPSYRATLAAYGHTSTTDYLARAARLALDAGLLPHTNAGVLSFEELARLRPLNASMGLMLESVSERLTWPGMAHHKAPDKRPQLRLRMIEDAGRLAIPFTTGLLLGIGETWEERVDTLLAIRALHRAHGHIQEVIVQPFRAGDGEALEPADEDLLRALAIARLVLDDEVSVQSPPNLSQDGVRAMIRAGLDDFGGISPLTPDFINPAYPWPHVDALREHCRAEGFVLRARLPIHARYVERRGFLDPGLRDAVEAAARRL